MPLGTRRPAFLWNRARQRWAKRGAGAEECDTGSPTCRTPGPHRGRGTMLIQNLRISNANNKLAVDRWRTGSRKSRRPNLVARRAVANVAAVVRSTQRAHVDTRTHRYRPRGDWTMPRPRRRPADGFPAPRSTSPPVRALRVRHLTKMSGAPARKHLRRVPFRLKI